MQPKASSAKPTELGKALALPCQANRVRFSLDGKRLVAACIDGVVRRWDVAGKAPTEAEQLNGHNGWVTDLEFGKDALFTADSWGKLAAWNSSGKEQWKHDNAHDGWLRMIAVHKAALATCGKDGFVRIWNATDGKKSAEFALPRVMAVRFSPDGKSLFAGDLCGTVREHALSSGKQLRTFEVKELYKLDRIQDVGGVRCLLFDAAGKTLFVAGAVPSTGGFVQCTPLIASIDLASGKRQWQWKGANDAEGYITDLACHPDGYLVASASGQPGQGKVFFLKPGEKAPFFIAAKPNVHSVAIDPAGTTLAAALTNANSSGNGRVGGAKYLPNVSPIQMWKVPRGL
ncbi:MAG TPA: hypothetical protein VGI99_02580 [Gemmataceae bacterium]|jgi:WD40 repeat protein